MFNILFSLFTIVTGYLELVRSIKGEGFLNSNPGFFGMNLLSLISAHVVVTVYMCFPKVAISDRFFMGRGRGNNNDRSDA